MKTLLLSLSLLTMSLGYSQTCTVDTAGLNTYIGSATWGAMPNVADNLPDGNIGTRYDAVLSFLMPTNAQELDPTFPSVGLASIQIKNIVGLPSGLTFVSSASTADSVFCSTANCLFPAGGYGCVRLIGTPDTIGVFPLTITLEGTAAGFPITQSDDLTGYSIRINSPVGLSNIDNKGFYLEQNVPNPFSEITTINYNVQEQSPVDFRVINILGETVFTKRYEAAQGKNSIVFNGSSLKKGIYLYSLRTNKGMVTKRMVIQK